MHVLVTGGAGFIGSHLVDRLLGEQAKVTVVDDLSRGVLHNLSAARRDRDLPLSFVRHDVAGAGFERAVAKAEPDVICHLAAQVRVPDSVDDPVRDAMTNVLGTVNVLEAARRHGVRKVVVASSGGAIYGDVDHPVEESHPTAPESPYAASKVAIEAYLEAFATLHGLGWTALALANVYGPRQPDEGEGAVVAAFCGRMLDARGVTIHGDGGQTRDLLFVADAVDAFVAALDAGDGERLNIGTGVATSVLDLHEQMIALTGSDRVPSYAPARDGDVRHSVLDASRASEVLGWRPVTSLADGLAATVSWFRGDRPARSGTPR